MIHPDPTCRPVDRSSGQLLVDECPGQWAVPPRTHGEPHTVDVDGATVDDQTIGSEFAQPGRGLLAGLAGSVEVVITRRGEHQRVLGETLQVLGDDHDLHLQRRCTDDLEQVTGQHDHVDVSCLLDQPVELREAVVQVRPYQRLHTTGTVPAVQRLEVRPVEVVDDKVIAGVHRRLDLLDRILGAFGSGWSDENMNSSEPACSIIQPTGSPANGVNRR